MKWEIGPDVGSRLDFKWHQLDPELIVWPVLSTVEMSGPFSSAMVASSWHEDLSCFRSKVLYKSGQPEQNPCHSTKTYITAWCTFFGTYPLRCCLLNSFKQKTTLVPFSPWPWVLPRRTLLEGQPPRESNHLSSLKWQPLEASLETSKTNTNQWRTPWSGICLFSNQFHDFRTFYTLELPGRAQPTRSGQRHNSMPASSTYVVESSQMQTSLVWTTKETGTCDTSMNQW